MSLAQCAGIYLPGLSISTFIDLVRAMGNSTGSHPAVRCHASETEYRHNLAAVPDELANHRYRIDTLWILLSQDRQIDIIIELSHGNIYIRYEPQKADAQRQYTKQCQTEKV
jgi:hypothetical protein